MRKAAAKAAQPAAPPPAPAPPPAAPPAAPAAAPAAAPPAAPKAAAPAAPAGKPQILQRPIGWDPGPADKYFNFQVSNKPGQEPYVYLNQNAALPTKLSDAQINQAQQIIDASNAKTPGGFQGIQDRLDEVKYAQTNRLVTAQDRISAIKELIRSVNPVLAKQILEAGGSTR